MPAFRETLPLHPGDWQALNEYLAALLNGGSVTTYAAVGQYGARGDGVTDDTAALQAAIDAASAAGGGIVFLTRGTYKVTGLTLKQGVKLVSYGTHYGYSGGGGSLTAKITTATANATIIDTPVGATFTPAIEGITIDGAGLAGIGVRLRATQWASLKNMHIVNCRDQGLLIEGGNACTMRDLLVTSCLQTQARAGVSGAVQLAGADHCGDNIEATAGAGALSDANAFCKAIVISGNNGRYTNMVGELSDGGIYVSGSYNRFAACRADLCYGHGWEITGANNTFAACHGVGCGSNAVNTYDHFKVSGTGNSFSACRSKHTGANTVKYGFEDTVNVAGSASKNIYDASCGGDGATAAFIAATFAGSGRHFAPFDVHPANLATQIDATGTSFIVLDNYAGATNVTDILGGVQGQYVSVYGNANVTIVHNGGSAGSTIKTNTGANVVLAAAKIYRFTFYAGTWYMDA